MQLGSHESFSISHTTYQESGKLHEACLIFGKCYHNHHSHSQSAKHESHSLSRSVQWHRGNPHPRASVKVSQSGSSTLAQSHGLCASETRISSPTNVLRYVPAGILSWRGAHLHHGISYSNIQKSIPTHSFIRCFCSLYPWTFDRCLLVCPLPLPAQRFRLCASWGPPHRPSLEIEHGNVSVHVLRYVLVQIANQLVHALECKPSLEWTVRSISHE